LPRDKDSARFEGRVEKRALLASDDIEVGGDGGDIDDLTCGAQLVGGVEPHLTEHSQVVY
jgi:hypothetical protein